MCHMPDNARSSPFRHRDLIKFFPVSDDQLKKFPLKLSQGLSRCLQYIYTSTNLTSTLFNQPGKTPSLSIRIHIITYITPQKGCD